MVEAVLVWVLYKIIPHIFLLIDAAMLMCLLIGESFILVILSGGGGLVEMVPVFEGGEWGVDWESLGAVESLPIHNNDFIKYIRIKCW